MMRAVAIFCAALALSGCIGPLDPMCYPDSCLAWLLTHSNDAGQEAPSSPQPPSDRR